jgi:hypothetical protein
VEPNKVTEKNTPPVNSMEEAEARAKAALSKPMTAQEREIFLSDLAKKYPEGVTVEEENYSRMKITRVIVVRNNKASEYKKVVFPYGTYYKKNGIDITENTFKIETKK